MRSRTAWFAAGVATAAWLQRVSARTGVTHEEAYSSMHGDDVIRQPMVQWTRGVTVDAPAAAIWPWLVQAGHGRAGWYTPRWVDDIINPMLFRTRITTQPAHDRIHPEFQQLDVGDVIADGPDHAAFFRVLEVEPRRAIVYHSIRHPWRGHPVDATDPEALRAIDQQLLDGNVYLDFTWTFELRPTSSDRTRLLVRTRANYAPRVLAPFVPLAGLFDATYGVAMLRAIAQRAERTTTSPTVQDPTLDQPEGAVSEVDDRQRAADISDSQQPARHP